MCIMYTDDAKMCVGIKTKYENEESSVRTFFLLQLYTHSVDRKHFD